MTLERANGIDLLSAYNRALLNSDILPPHQKLHLISDIVFQMSGLASAKALDVIIKELLARRDLHLPCMPALLVNCMYTQVVFDDNACEFAYLCGKYPSPIAQEYVDRAGAVQCSAVLKPTR